MDSPILCQDQEIERSGRLHLPEMSGRKTHDATFESSANSTKD